MENWNDLRFCLALYRYKTMSSAADHLSTNVGTVSRRIHKLSERLGFPLFLKDGAAWKATAQAMGVIGCAEETERQLQRIEAEENESCAPREIRINCDTILRQSPMVRAIQTLYHQMPDVRLLLRFADASLAYGETDILLTSAQIDEGNLIRRRVGALTSGVWCGADFQGKVDSWVRLEGSGCIDTHNAALQAAYGPEYMTTGDGNICAEIIQSAPFAAAMSTEYATQRGGLRMMPEFETATQEIYIYVHATRQKDQGLRGVIDWLSDTFRHREDRIIVPAMFETG